ncbi:MAG: MBL fold metallo-hydrolase, partial [Anaerolineales bacterium]
RGKIPANFPIPLLVLWLIKGFLVFSFKQAVWGKPFEKFEPDLLLEEGQSLAEYGFDATIIYTPGHSKGSISVLTNDNRDLICGDLFSIAWGRIIKSIDENGLKRLKELEIKNIYPGHGNPFSMQQIS